MHLHLSLKTRIMHFLSTLLPFKSYDTHVKISKRGHEIMNNKELASKTIDAIMANKQTLESGKTVQVKDENISIGTVTSIPDIQPK